MLKEVTEGTGILVEHVRRNIFPETECKKKIGNCHLAASEVAEELFTSRWSGITGLHEPRSPRGPGVTGGAVLGGAPGTL